MKLKSDLAIELAKKLTDDPRTEDTAISVLDDNGVVTLTGTAPSHEAKDAAIEIANEHEQVHSVIADIKIVEDEDDLRGLTGLAAMPYTPDQSGSPR